MERTLFPGAIQRRDGRIRTTPSPAGRVSLLDEGDPTHVIWADDPNWSQSVDAEIATWPDRGSSAGNFTADPGLRPVLKSNVTALGGRKAALFTADILGRDIVDDAQPYRVVIVFARTDTTNASRILLSRDLATATFDVGASNTYTLNAGSAVTDGASNVTTGQIAILALNGASSSFGVLPVGASGSGNAGAGALAGVYLGGTFIAQNYQGYVAFCGVYDVEADLDSLIARLTSYYNLA